MGQIEIRTQTHLAACKGLIALFNKHGDEGDPHTVTASKIFQVPLDVAKLDKYRYPTKRAGFGVIYGIGAPGLANQIAEYIADLQMEGEEVNINPMTEADCAKFIEDYYKLYPEIRDYQLEAVASARRFGYVTDMFGRIRFVPEIYCPIESVQEAGARQAANFPVTASAQGIIKLAMVRLFADRNHRGWNAKVKFLMQIHDSLLIQVDDNPEFVSAVAHWVKDALCNTVQLCIPIDADVKVGKNWGEMQKYKLEEHK